ncbi:MAG: response regulator transcription factor [Sediminibacterium sp.]
MNHPTVLMVEDHKELRESLYESLSYSTKVIAVSNGIDALAVLKSEIPDIILLDIMLPFPLDGFSILRILKNDVKLAAIPVVLMSATNSDDKISMGLEMGANDYIVKPFKINDLLLKVKNLVALKKEMQNQFEKQLFLKEEANNPANFEQEFKKSFNMIVEETIDENTFSVQEIAEKLSMSVSTLERWVLRFYQTTPKKYIIRSKLMKAEIMLRQNLGSVKDIAYTTGFNSAPYFCACFKKEYGRSPLAFKRSSSMVMAK